MSVLNPPENHMLAWNGSEPLTFPLHNFCMGGFINEMKEAFDIRPDTHIYQRHGPMTFHPQGQRPVFRPVIHHTPNKAIRAISQRINGINSAREADHLVSIRLELCVRNIELGQLH